jgi:hypothetical protein
MDAAAGVPTDVADTTNPSVEGAPLGGTAVQATNDATTPTTAPDPTTTQSSTLSQSSASTLGSTIAIIIGCLLVVLATVVVWGVKQRAPQLDGNDLPLAARPAASPEDAQPLKMNGRSSTIKSAGDVVTNAAYAAPGSTV